RQPGALPLLQYALTELFENREGHTLTLAAYHSIGGVVGALAQQAEALYAEQSVAGPGAVRQLFLRLVAVQAAGSDAVETQRRVPRSELLELAAEPELMELAAEPELMEEVLDAFAAYRLLSLDRDPVTRSATVEVAHAAL